MSLASFKVPRNSYLSANQLRYKRVFPSSFVYPRVLKFEYSIIKAFPGGTVNVKPTRNAILIATKRRKIIRIFRAKVGPA